MVRLNRRVGYNRDTYLLCRLCDRVAMIPEQVRRKLDVGQGHIVGQVRPFGNGAALSAQRTASAWVETSLIAPGETAQIDVHVTVNKRMGRDKRVSFRLHSRATDQENAPAQVEEVNVELPGKR